MGTLNTGLKDFLGFQQDQGTSKMLDRCKLLTFLTVFDNEMRPSSNSIAIAKTSGKTER